MSRKRDRAEMESSEPTAKPSMLTRLRDMWEFSNLMQYIFIFGKAVKIDEELTIEVDQPAISNKPEITLLTPWWEKANNFLWAYSV